MPKLRGNRTEWSAEGGFHILCEIALREEYFFSLEVPKKERGR